MVVGTRQAKVAGRRTSVGFPPIRQFEVRRVGVLTIFAIGQIPISVAATNTGDEQPVARRRRWVGPAVDVGGDQSAAWPALARMARSRMPATSIDLLLREQEIPAQPRSASPSLI